MSKHQSYLAFDFETTGLYPDRDRIIQVGICRVENGEMVEGDCWLVRQNVRIAPDARARHGISDADVQARGIDPTESINRLLEAIRSATICIGHNIHRFDVPFLLNECRRLRLPAPDCREFIDTAALYKGARLNMTRLPTETFARYADRVLSVRAPGLKYSIEACTQALRIKADSVRLHDAGGDAYLTHLIYEALGKVK